MLFLTSLAIFCFCLEKKIPFFLSKATTDLKRQLTKQSLSYHTVGRLLLLSAMKEDNEDRLQRAKNKLNNMKDDGSITSYTSRKSYNSDYSRASTATRTREKGPRSEWRNKARAVIERGQKLKEETADILRDDASARSRSSLRSSENREADIDSLVARNVRLNERERALKIEKSLLDAAEAEALNSEDDASCLSYKSSATVRTAEDRAKRFQDVLTKQASRSFHETKATWQDRTEKNLASNPIQRKFNTLADNDTDQVDKQAELLTLARSFSYNKKGPESPQSVKSAKSIRSCNSETVLKKYSKSGKYGAMTSSDSVESNFPTPSRSKSSAEKTSNNHQYLASTAASRGERQAREDSLPRHTLSVSNPSNYNKRNKYSNREEKDNTPLEDLENAFPSEPPVPFNLDEEKKCENQAPSRELSYRERSAMRASSSVDCNNISLPHESGTDDEGPSERNIFRQRGKLAKKQKNQSSITSAALAEKKDFNNTSSVLVANGFNSRKIESAKKAIMPNTTQQQPNTPQKQSGSDNVMEMNNLRNENKELRSRLEKERACRSELDEKTASLQLEIHKQKAQIESLRMRKDVSTTHKEQIYKMEDALQETNQQLHVVVDENLKLQETLEQERARRIRAENQAKHYRDKSAKKSDEVVVLARELQRKADECSDAMAQEQRLREVAESQLAKACFHIKNTESERNEELEELEKENIELRHTLHRMEQFIKQQMSASKNSSKSCRQSGPSLQHIHEEGISSKPSWGGKSAISEITTDFEYSELNSSQMGEI